MESHWRWWAPGSISATAKQAEQALRQHTRQLQILYNVSQDILSAREPGSIALAALNGLKDIIPSPRISAVEFDYTTDRGNSPWLWYRAKHLKPMLMCALPLSYFPVDVLAKGDIYHVEDLAQLDIPSSILQILLSEGIRGHVQVPILAQGQLIGSLTVGCDQPLPAYTHPGRNRRPIGCFAGHRPPTGPAQRTDPPRRRNQGTAPERDQSPRQKQPGFDYWSASRGGAGFAKEHERDIYRTIVSDLSNRIQGMATVPQYVVGCGMGASVPDSACLRGYRNHPANSAARHPRHPPACPPSRIKIAPKQVNSLGLILNDVDHKCHQTHGAEPEKSAHSGGNQPGRGSCAASSFVTMDLATLIMRWQANNTVPDLTLISSIVHNDMDGKPDSQERGRRSHHHRVPVAARLEQGYFRWLPSIGILTAWD